MFYLLKTEPSEYSFADLQRDKTTVWDGVTNPVGFDIGIVLFSVGFGPGVKQIGIDFHDFD